jgi:hypothetical protein
VRSGFMSMKNSMTPSGIEPVTFGFVAQYLNHCATEVHLKSNWVKKMLGLRPLLQDWNIADTVKIQKGTVYPSARVRALYCDCSDLCRVIAT